MKKKILSLLLICTLASLTIMLTGCGKKSENETTKMEEKSTSSNSTGENISMFDYVGRYVNGYIWVNVRKEDIPKDLTEPSSLYYLLDKEGKIIFQTERGGFTNVHSDYFICAGTLYDIKANKVDLGEYSDYEKDIGTDNFQRDILRLKKETETFNGTESNYIYMDLKNMSKINDVEDDDFISYEEAKCDYGIDYSNYYMKYYPNKVNSFERTSKSDFERKTEIEDGVYTCVENNGFFTVYDSNKKQLYEPIEGNVLDLDRETKKIIYSVDKEIFVADDKGNTTKIDGIEYIDKNNVSLCDDIIIYQIKNITNKDENGKYILLKANGEKITMHK